jgi:hypothetical protein
VNRRPPGQSARRDALAHHLCRKGHCIKQLRKLHEFRKTAKQVTYSEAHMILIALIICAAALALAAFILFYVVEMLTIPVRQHGGHDGHAVPGFGKRQQGRDRTA